MTALQRHSLKNRMLVANLSANLISAVIITRNEARNIGPLIEGVLVD